LPQRSCRRLWRQASSVPQLEVAVQRRRALIGFPWGFPLRPMSTDVRAIRSTGISRPRIRVRTG
jgi:hypothetical protein